MFVAEYWRGVGCAAVSGRAALISLAQLRGEAPRLLPYSAALDRNKPYRSVAHLDTQPVALDSRDMNVAAAMDLCDRRRAWHRCSDIPANRASAGICDPPALSAGSSPTTAGAGAAASQHWRRFGWQARQWQWLGARLGSSARTSAYSASRLRTAIRFGAEQVGQRQMRVCILRLQPDRGQELRLGRRQLVRLL